MRVMGQWRKVRYLPEIAKSGYFCGIVRGLGRDGEIQREFVLCSGGKSLSAAFTQNRLFRPECVSAGILMLTYLSTLRSKTPALPFQDAKRVFCKFAQHQPSPSLRSGEFKEGDATICF